MRLILIGGGETIETIYFLAKLFARRGHRLTIVNPHPDEARMLSRQVEATVILGDGSDPVVLEQAGARKAEVLLSLAPYDPDKLVTCQIAQRLHGVPRTIRLVNDPDDEQVFRELGITEVFSATRMLGSVLERQTIFDEITHPLPAAEGQVHVTEIVLAERAPAVGKSLSELKLPGESLIAAIIRDGHTHVPRPDAPFEAADRLILVAVPQNQEQVLQILTGVES